MACLRYIRSGQPEQHPKALCMAPRSTHKQRGHAVSIARCNICARLHAKCCSASHLRRQTRLSYLMIASRVEHTAADARQRWYLCKQRNSAKATPRRGKQQRRVAVVAGCIGAYARRCQQQPQHCGVSFQRCICIWDTVGMWNTSGLYVKPCTSPFPICGRLTACGTRHSQCRAVLPLPARLAFGSAPASSCK